MSTIRLIHIVTALTFLVSGLVRTYWLLAGNRFARWSAFIPTTRYQAHRAVPPGRLLRLRPQGDPRRSSATTSWPRPPTWCCSPCSSSRRSPGFALDGLMGAEPGATLFGWLRELLGPADAAPGPPPVDVADPRDRAVPRLQLHPRRPHRAQRPDLEHRAAARSSRPATRSSRRATAVPSCWTGSSHDRAAGALVVIGVGNVLLPRRRRRRPRDRGPAAARGRATRWRSRPGRASWTAAPSGSTSWARSRDARGRRARRRRATSGAAGGHRVASCRATRSCRAGRSPDGAAGRRGRRAARRRAAHGLAARGGRPRRHRGRPTSASGSA